MRIKKLGLMLIVLLAIPACNKGGDENLNKWEYGSPTEEETVSDKIAIINSKSKIVETNFGPEYDLGTLRALISYRYEPEVLEGYLLSQGVNLYYVNKRSSHPLSLANAPAQLVNLWFENANNNPNGKVQGTYSCGEGGGGQGPSIILLKEDSSTLLHEWLHHSFRGKSVGHCGTVKELNEKVLGDLDETVKQLRAMNKIRLLNRSEGKDSLNKFSSAVKSLKSSYYKYLFEGLFEESQIEYLLIKEGVSSDSWYFKFSMTMVKGPLDTYSSLLKELGIMIDDWSYWNEATTGVSKSDFEELANHVLDEKSFVKRIQKNLRYMENEMREMDPYYSSR